MADRPVKEKLNAMQELLSELMPEELEPRLELQVFLDPMSAIDPVDDNNNNNNNNPNNNNNNNNNS